MLRLHYARGTEVGTDAEGVTLARWIDPNTPEERVTVITDALEVAKIRPKGNNELPVDWVRNTINGVDYWVLASKA